MAPSLGSVVFFRAAQRTQDSTYFPVYHKEYLKGTDEETT
jgi:hypothetical protein